MTVVWCSGPVPTKAIVHGGLADPSEAMPVPAPSMHTHTHTSDYQAKPDKWGAYRTAGKGLALIHPRAPYPHPHPLCLAHSGGSSHTHTHAHMHIQSIHPLQKKQLLYCVSVLFFFFQPIPALTVKTGALWFSWDFTLTKTSQRDQSVWGLTHKKTWNTLQSCWIIYLSSVLFHFIIKTKWDILLWSH